MRGDWGKLFFHSGLRRDPDGDGDCFLDFFY
jgi:hypothetical protein